MRLVRLEQSYALQAKLKEASHNLTSKQKQLTDLNNTKTKRTNMKRVKSRLKRKKLNKSKR